MKFCFVGVTSILFLLGCTTVQKIKRPEGVTEFLIACGAGSGWNICYEKANELCPLGYKTLFEDAGFNRKELRISCPTTSE
ncbi:MAG: hypothetical protein DU489_05770 [Nitrosomonas sp.]